MCWWRQYRGHVKEYLSRRDPTLFSPLLTCPFMILSSTESKTSPSCSTWSSFCWCCSTPSSSRSAWWLCCWSASELCSCSPRSTWPSASCCTRGSWWEAMRARSCSTSKRCQDLILIERKHAYLLFSISLKMFLLLRCRNVCCLFHIHRTSAG